nr:acrosin-like [Anolis sagrei ordinatus]
MQWAFLQMLLLAIFQPVKTDVSNCDGTCGRRPLAASQEMSRLIGGTNALPGTWPWQVSIQALMRGGYYLHICGGTLISARWVLSAAHCFGKPKDQYKLLLGCNRVNLPGPDSRERFIKTLVKHEDFRSTLNTGGTIFNDIALVEMSKPVNCSDYIQPACLPDNSMAVTDLTHCYLSGWGRTDQKKQIYPDILQEGKVDLIPRWNCSQWWNRILPPMNLCAGTESGSVDFCQGDSGGPVQCRESRSERFWVLGVLSWGSLDCAVVKKPSIFISTQYFLDWIEEHSKETFQRPPQPPLLAQLTTTTATTTIVPTTPPVVTWAPYWYLTWARPTQVTPWLPPWMSYGRWRTPRWRPMWRTLRPWTTRRFYISHDSPHHERSAQTELRNLYSELYLIDTQSDSTPAAATQSGTLMRYLVEVRPLYDKDKKIKRN